MTDDEGRTHAKEILRAPGDADNPLSWDALGEKFGRVTGRAPGTVSEIAKACQNLASPTGLADLLALVEREMRTGDAATAG